MTPPPQKKTIYHARKVNRWKSLGETSTFHRFTNLRRDNCLYLVVGYLFTIYKAIGVRIYSLIRRLSQRILIWPFEYTIAYI